MKKTLIFAILTLAVLLSGCGAQKPETRPVSANAVDIQGFAFSPDAIIIKYSFYFRSTIPYSHSYSSL